LVRQVITELGAGLNQGNRTVSLKNSKIMPVGTRGVSSGGRTRLCRLASGVVKFCQKNKHTLSQFLSFNNPNLLFLCRRGRWTRIVEGGMANWAPPVPRGV
jgi:hypothetical protein